MGASNTPTIFLHGYSLIPDSRSRFSAQGFAYNNQAGSDHHHGQTELLPPRQAETQQSEVGVGFAEELDKEAEGAVADHIEGHHVLFEPGLAVEPEENGEKNDPFKEEFVELGWMAQGLRLVHGKQHADGGVRGAPVKLSIDEVPEAPPSVSERGCHEAQVVPSPVVPFVLVNAPGRPQESTDQATMIGHARDSRKMESALPGNGEYCFEGVLHIIAQIIEHDITKSRADEDPANNPGRHVIKLFFGDAHAIALDGSPHQLITGKKGCEVHETIPTDGKGADGNQGRIHVLGNQSPPGKCACVDHAAKIANACWGSYITCMSAISVSLQNLRKRYPGAPGYAVEDFSLEVRESEFVVLVGHSGCGKSTVLRMIAGLESPTEGDVWIGGQHCTHLDPKDRDIAMVFQSYALYPHMTVRQNLEFGLKLARRMTRGEIDARVREAAEILGIQALLERKPRQLSGGERQRVALGRAIVRKPRVFLFDEPLSNLDANMRAQMRVELGKLHARLQTTMIYVTHDQIEAMTMGDRIVCMKSGRVQQVGSPMDLYSQPSNEYVGAFIGSPPMNFVVVDCQNRRAHIRDTEVKMPQASPMLDLLDGAGAIHLGIRPEHLHLVQESDGVIPAVVEVVEPLGFETLVYAGYGQGTLIVRLQNERIPEIGERIFLRPAEPHMHWFDAVSGVRLVQK